MDWIETEVLVIGCGLAGCITALQLADSGVPVTVVTRTLDPHETNTYLAQGGIILRGLKDSPQLLAENVIKAGAGHGNTKAIDILAKQGPELVRDILIDQINVQFDRENDGELSLAREGGHSIPRIVHVADATGKAIELLLIKAMKDVPNITLLTGFTSVDLLTPSHHSLNRLAVYERQSCVGAYLLDQKKDRVIRCLAKKTILATGGLGQIFLRTTNPVGARGDGLAMAFRTGARVINNEFIQFHPTAFFYQDSPRFLISEAVRGAGARLVNEKGDPFMQKYEPEWRDLAPRDVVSRGAYQEMLSHDVPNVFLDVHSFLSADKIKEKFPNIYENCLSYGVDITKEFVPVVPAAHYACGGVWVDEWGQTTIENLYAAGEVSCTGVHGANRLASTSLLECLVWGYRVAQHVKRTIADLPPPGVTNIPDWQDTGLDSPDQALISQDMSSVKHIMWNYVGLIRTTPRLERAMNELRNLGIEIERFYRTTRLTDSLIGLRNAVRAAMIVTSAAWENKASIGCHYRES